MIQFILKKTMLRYSLTLGLFLFFGCQDTKPSAQGGDNEVVLIASKYDQVFLMKAVSMMINDTLFTPQPEEHFKIIPIEPDRFNDVSDYVNVVVGAIGDYPSNKGTSLIKSILTNEQYLSSMNGNNHLIFSKDVFARDQNFLVINGPSSDKVYQASYEQGPWLKKQFDDLFIKRQSLHLFDESTLQAELQTSLLNKYNWSIKIPWGYSVIRDSSDQKFFWIGRELPFRWLAIKWEDGLVFSDSASARKFSKSIPLKYFRNIQYIDYKFKIQPSTFNSYGSWKITGLWESLNDAQGGPFISHLFYDADQDRSYFIHSMIFHPGKDKYLLLRQVDMIARTFKTTTAVDK